MTILWIKNMWQWVMVSLVSTKFGTKCFLSKKRIQKNLRKMIKSWKTTVLPFPPPYFNNDCPQSLSKAAASLSCCYGSISLKSCQNCDFPVSHSIQNTEYAENDDLYSFSSSVLPSACCSSKCGGSEQSVSWELLSMMLEQTRGKNLEK